MAIPINDVKPGVTVEIGSDLFRCLEFNLKRAAQQARIKIKFKNLRSGATIEKTFNTGEKIERAHIEYKQMQFLYADPDSFHFMDQSTYEQIVLPKEKIGDDAKYLKEGMAVNISFYGAEALDVNLPAMVELKVVETAPGFKGDTVSGGKPATLETGAVIQVPFFVNVGDVLKVNTQEDRYIGRAWYIMVDWNLVKKLIKTVKEEGISGLAVEEGGVKYEVRSEGGKIVSSHVHAVSAPVPAPVPAEPKAEDEGLVAITSPMVGTFYCAPSPEAPPFVSVGDEISPGKVVCIVEAMKLFNEIEGEVQGKLVKILVENGQPVEYGQKLMLIKKA